MTTEEQQLFLELVARMRQAQRDHSAARRNPDSRTRSLKLARELEKQVDAVINNWRVPF